jgi:hypothetical protein
MLGHVNLPGDQANDAKRYGNPSLSVHRLLDYSQTANCQFIERLTLNVEH